MVVIYVGLCTSLHCNPALSTVYSCGMQYLAGYLAGNGNVGLSARLTVADNKQCRVVLMEDAATLVLSTFAMLIFFRLSYFNFILTVVVVR